MFKKILFILGIFILGSTVKAQDLSGREFWFVVSENSGGASATNTYLLSLVSDYCATVTVEVPNLGWSETVTLTPGLPSDVTFPNRISGQTIFHDNVNVIEGKGVHITSDFPIVVYAVMYAAASTDAETILPMRMMGTEYITTFRTVMRNGSTNYPYLTVVATEDDTDVIIDTYDGVAPRQVTFTLDRGETYMIDERGVNCGPELSTTYRCWSFSGSKVKATKPIGVVTSTPCSDFPQCGACDGMMAMFMPIEEWGTNYVSSQVTKRRPVQACGGLDGIADVMEITGPIGTNVSISNMDGTTNLTITGTSNNGAPDYGYGSVVWNNPPFGGATHAEVSGEANMTIVADQPVQVVQYSKAYGFDNTPDTDPECIVLYPQKMWESEYLVGNPPTLTGTAYKAVVMVDKTDVPDPRSTLELDGAPVGMADWQDIGGTNYSFRRLFFAGAITHTLEEPNGSKFGVYISLVGNAESYTTMGGMSPLIENPCPDCPIVDFDFTEPCVGAESNFTDLSTDPNAGIDVVQWDWDFGDGNTTTVSTAPGDVTHTYTAPGLYYVTLSITNNADPDPCTVSITKKVRVFESPLAAAGPDQQVCAGDEVEIGGNPTASGGEAPLTIVWTGGTVDDPSAARPTATNTTSTTYYVEVTDFNGCVWKDSLDWDVTPVTNLSLVNGSEVCVGENGTVELSYDGADPIDVVLRSSNSEEESFTGVSSGVLSLTTTQSGRWWIKSATRNPADGKPECIEIGTDTVDVTVKSGPVVELYQDMTLCEGTDSLLWALVNAGSGGPYTFFFSSDQGSGFNVSTPTDSVSYNLNGLTVTTVYTLDSVGYQTGKLCPSYPNQTATVTVNPMPYAGEDGDFQLCNTLPDHDLNTNLTGGPVTTGTWIDLDGSGGLSGNLLDTRNVAEGTYVFRYKVAGLAPCPVDSADIAVTINTAPKFANVEEICSADALTYTVIADVVGGTNPTITSGNGTIDASRVMTSDPFTTSTPYQIIVTDEFECGADTITGFKKCDCITSAGTMRTDTTLQICDGDGIDATLLFNNDYVDDGDDRNRFVLHDGSGKSLGNVLDEQDQPIFVFPTGNIVYGNTYYISSIAGNIDGSGIDKTEDCFDVANGTPVIFIKRPTVDFGNDTTICTGGTALISATFTGTSPFSLVHGTDTISGLNSPDVLSFSPTVDTTITVVEVFNNVCNNIINKVININVNNAPSANIHDGNIFCANDPSAVNNVQIDLDGDGNIFSVTYLLRTDGIPVDTNTIGNLAAGNNQILNVGNLGVGNHVIVPVNVTDNSGGTCPGILSGSANVIIHQTPNASLSIPNPAICLGDSVELVFDLSPISDTYTIDVIDGQGNTYSYTGVQNLEGIYVTPLAANTYSFEITNVVNEVTGCVGVVNGGAISVQVNPAPTATLSGDKQYCFGGDSVVLNMAFSGFPPFDLNFRANGLDVYPNPITVTNDTTFVFFPSPGVHVYDVFYLADQSAGQCPGIGLNTSTFTVDALPTAQFNGNFDICAGDSLFIDLDGTGNGPITATIEDDLGNSFPVTFDPNNPIARDTFLVNVMDTVKYFFTNIEDSSTPNKCYNTSADTLNVFVNAIPTATIDVHPDNPEVCFGDNAKFQFSIFGTDRAVVGYTNLQTGTYATKTVLASSNPRSVTFTGLDLGYNVVRLDSVTSTLGAQCSSTPLLLDSVLVNPIPDASIVANVNEICEDDAAVLTIDAEGRMPIDVTVNNEVQDSTFTLTQTGNTAVWNVNPASTTLYRIVSILDGSNPQCSNDSRDGNDQVTIDVNPLPTATVSDTTFNICEGESVSFPIYVTGTGNKSIVIENSFGSIDTLSTAGELITYTVAPTAVGSSSYFIRSIQDSKNCSNTGTGLVTVEVKPAPVVDFQGINLSGCPPIEPVFTNTSTGAYASCLWNFGDGNVATNNCDQVKHVYNAPGLYTVSLQLTTAEGCVSNQTKDQFVNVFSQPVADFAVATTNPTIRNSVVEFKNTSGGATNFLWTFGELGQSTDKDPTFQFPFEEEGEYLITLVASNLDGCVDSTTQKIKIEGVMNVNIPNTFTPDGDGNNEIFIPVITGYDSEFADYEFTVFDRWGIPIFQTNVIDEGWDGTMADGKIKAKPDSYVYVVKIRSKYDAERHEYTGPITLVR